MIVTSQQPVQLRIERFNLMEWTIIHEKDRQEGQSEDCGEERQAEDREARPGDEGRHTA